MKRIALIFLIFVYAFSTTGISLKAFYCCGKLQSLKIALAESGKNTDGCCKTTYQSIKVKDTHAPTDALNVPILQHAGADSLNSVSDAIAFILADPAGLIIDHAPPLYGGVALHISHCIYRI